MTALQQIRELRAMAVGRADAFRSSGDRQMAALWQVKVDTYNLVIKLLEEENERENAGLGKGKEADSR